MVLIDIVYTRCKSPGILRNLERHDPDDVCIFAMTLAEPENGVSMSSNPMRNALSLTMMLSEINVLPFDDAAAVCYGEVRATPE